jgi:hypothetical protein
MVAINRSAAALARESFDATGPPDNRINKLHLR